MYKGVKYGMKNRNHFGVCTQGRGAYLIINNTAPYSSKEGFSPWEFKYQEATMIPQSCCKPHGSDSMTYILIKSK